MVSSQLIGCITILAGVFTALILVAGSRDAQIVTGLLVVIAIAVAVPAARRWVQRVRRDSVREMLREARAELILPEGVPHTPASDRSSADRLITSRSEQ